MNAHPVLYELSRRGSLTLSDDGFTGHVLWEENRHHDRHRIILAGNPQNLGMDLTYIIELRYPLQKSPCVRMYVKALQKLINEEEFLISMKDLFRIEGQTHYDAVSVSHFTTIQQIVQFWYCEMAKCNQLFDQIASLARVTYRLGDRSGTDQYRKLLPTRLAEFTLCGMRVSDTVH